MSILLPLKAPHFRGIEIVIPKGGNAWVYINPQPYQIRNEQVAADEFVLTVNGDVSRLGRGKAVTQLFESQ